MYIPNQCSLTSKNINVAKLEEYFLKDEQIMKDENLIDIFTIEETKISGSSVALQKKIAREMGKNNYKWPLL